MRIGSLRENIDALGLLLATGVFCLLRVVLGVNVFLSMIIGLIVGLVFVGVCNDEMNIYYNSVRKSGGFWKWILQGYWSVSKAGEREWGIRILGLLIDNEPRGGTV